MALFKLISQAENPKMVKHFLYLQHLVRTYVERELSDNPINPKLFDKWYKRLETVQAQLSENDKEIIQEIYKPV